MPSNKLGIEHCYFRFHFAGEKPNKQATLALPGITNDGIMINGWKVQPLIPLVVSELCNVIYYILIL